LLPDGDPLRGELAAEGLSQLAGSADASPATTAANELMSRCQAAPAAGEPAREPESFPLNGGDLNWDVDWEVLRGPAEAARNLTTMLPFLTSMLPPQAPLRQALTSITEVMDAFDRGQWSPERDAALQAAIKQVEAVGLGTGLGLRTIAMMMRVQRCQQAQQQGTEPDWPSLAELDTLIAGLESAEDLARSLGAPFQAVDGLHHLYIAGVIMMRLLVGARRRDVRRDTAWRDGILRLLDQASDHLRQAPPAYAGQVQAMRGKLAEISTALSRTTMPPGPPPAATPDPPPPAPSPDPLAPEPAETMLTGIATGAEGVEAGWFNPAIGQFSQRVLSLPFNLRVRALP
jgi:hypothetical protein